MPNCDFYAAGDDLVQVLDFVFASGDCRVFESYSPLDQNLAEFKNTADVSKRYPLGRCAGTAPSVLLSLWPVRASASVRPRRIGLVPAECDGATFRWTLEGWGLIALHLGGASPAGIVGSHSNHNSEARARKWEPTLAETLGAPADWDWSEVSRVSARLNRHVRHLAVSKAGSRSVLPEAARLNATGVALV